MTPDLDPSTLIGWLVALGAGLMVGTERERRQLDGPRGPAGLRTYTLTALAGAGAMAIGGPLLLAAATLSLSGLIGIAYWLAKEDDRGLTSEVALLLTLFTGALAMQQPLLAAGLAVTMTLLLHGRGELHRFVTTTLSEDELHHALMFAAATLIVLPLLPDRAMGPYDAFNPRKVWLVVILVMAVGAAGHMLTRLVGARWGLPIAGLASGFVSSTATIGAMGGLASRSPEALPGAVAGAMLSNVATLAQMALVLAAVSMPVLQAMMLPLAAGGLAALAYSGLFMAHALKAGEAAEPARGAPFSISGALAFAATLAVILLLAAMLRDWFGQAGVLAAAALGGLADTHSAAISVATLAAGGKIDADAAVLPILAAFTTNTVSKIIMATSAGPNAFRARMVPGLLIIAAAAWAGWFAAGLLSR